MDINVASHDIAGTAPTSQIMREVYSSPEIWVDDGDGSRELWLVVIQNGCLSEAECFTFVVDEEVTFLYPYFQTGHHTRLGYMNLQGEICG